MKNKKEVSIIGRIVMVYPYLTTDPARRQGEIGKVIEASANGNLLTIEFDDGKSAVYMSDALLTLYPAQVILQSLCSNKETFTERDRSDLLKVYQFVIDKKYVEALKLAKMNSTTSFFAMTTCSDWMNMKTEQKRNQHRRRRP